MDVYIAPRKGYEHYHTNKTCWSLQQANHIVMKQKSNVADIDECSFCRGEYNRSENPKKSLRAKIENGEINTD